MNVKFLVSVQIVISVLIFFSIKDLKEKLPYYSKIEQIEAKKTQKDAKDPVVVMDALERGEIAKLLGQYNLALYDGKHVLQLRSNNHIIDGDIFIEKGDKKISVLSVLMSIAGLSTIQEEASVSERNSLKVLAELPKHIEFTEEQKQARAKLDKLLAEQPNMLENVIRDAGETEQAEADDQDSKESPRINTEMMKETATSITYGETRLPKIGYSESGSALSDDIRKRQIQSMMRKIEKASDKWSIVYPAKGNEKTAIAVFSDPTCPVCKRFVSQIPEFQNAGITVYHMFYNRNITSGNPLNSTAAIVDQQMKRAWCASDQHAGILALYSGKSLDSCADDEDTFPGNEHYMLGRLLDMQGTPYIISREGMLAKGYSTSASQPANLLKRLNIE